MREGERRVKSRRDERRRRFQFHRVAKEPRDDHAPLDLPVDVARQTVCQQAVRRKCVAHRFLAVRWLFAPVWMTFDGCSRPFCALWCAPRSTHRGGSRFVENVCSGSASCCEAGSQQPVSEIQNRRDRNGAFPNSQTTRPARRTVRNSTGRVVRFLCRVARRVVEEYYLPRQPWNCSSMKRCLMENVFHTFCWSRS